MRATLQDIAERCGLSPMTVSRILNHQAYRHRPETVARVRRAASELGYRQHAGAKSLRTGRFDTVALLQLHDTRDAPLPALLLDGLQKALAEHGLALLLARLPKGLSGDRDYLPQVLRQTSVDGLIVNTGSQTPPRLGPLIAKLRIPTVWLDAARSDNCVRADDEQAARLLTEHLHSLGHRRIAYVDFRFEPRHRPRHLWRLEGYLSAMSKLSLRPHPVVPRRLPPQDQYAQLALRTLGASRPPTAVVTPSAVEAVAFLWAGAAQMRLEVPGELSVATVDAEPVYAGLSLTSAVRPFDRMGRAAVEILSRRIENPAHTFPARLFPYELHPGRTTAAPA